MFVGNENINEKIERYARIIADKYQVAIEFFPIRNPIDGPIGFLVDDENYILSNTILPTDIEPKFVVMISRDYDAKYNLFKTEISGRYKEKD
jgi:hypothetical protein